MKFEGLEELDQKFDRLLSLDTVKEIVRSNGAALHKEMAKNASRQVAFLKGYSTGQTRRSITTELSDEGLTSTTMPNTDYAAYVEYGTRFMEAEPFVRPAYNKQKEVFKAELERIVE